MKRPGRIAIGWTDIGDLEKASFSSSRNLAELIAKAYHPLKNAHLGGPSLWNLYKVMKEGDLVIVNANSKRVCVFEVVGPYVFEEREGQILGYGHQRSASLTGLNPQDLWNNSGAAVASAQNIRWTLAACTASSIAAEAILKEGQRFSVMSTVIERNPYARQKCIDIHGDSCFVCGFNFEKHCGELGHGYIHVHHRVDMASKAKE